jgi:hypothetical protein
VIPVTGFSITQRRNEQEFVRWCFASVIDADDFAQQFGGTRIQPEAIERSACRRR